MIAALWLVVVLIGAAVGTTTARYAKDGHVTGCSQTKETKPLSQPLDQHKGIIS